MNEGIADLSIPILALLIPIVAIVMGTISKMRRERLLHETIRTLTAQGKEIPPELFSRNPFKDVPPELLGNLDQFGKKRDLEWTPKRQLRAAVINIGVGIGLAGFLFVMSPQSWFWAVSLLPLSVGLALLVLWKIESSGKAAQ